MLETSSRPLINPAPVSASCAEDITASIIFEMTCIGALCGGGACDSRIGKEGLLDRK